MDGGFDLATIDIAIVAVYAVATLAIGLWVGRGKKSGEEFFLGGRSAIWPIVGLSLMAANLSGTSYVGLAGAGYSEGISVWNYEWMAALVLVFFALFILPFYLRSKVDTVPEFLERRYDRRSRYAFSAFSVFTAMFIDAAGALFAGAITIELLFPELPTQVAVAMIAAVGGIYVLSGGLGAVHITDTIQGILLLVAGGIIFALVFAEIGGTTDAVRDAAPEGGLTVTPPADDDFLPWPGIFTGVIWLGFYYWTTNHVVVQKVLSAKDTNHGRWGALFCGLLQLPLLAFLILPGLMGRDVYPDIDNPDQIWQTLAFDFLPIGIRGLVLAALLAALMSTLDSVLNGASSLITNDFVKNLRGGISERRLVMIGRINVGILMIVAALWAPRITEFPTIVEYFQAFLGHITPPVVVVFLAGLFWTRGTAHAAFWTLSTVIPIGLVAFVCGELLEIYDLQFLYASGMVLVLSVAIYVGVTLATQAPERADVEEYVWSREHWREESEELRDTPWYFNYRVLAGALTVVTLVSVGVFVG